MNCDEEEIANNNDYEIMSYFDRIVFEAGGTSDDVKSDCIEDEEQDQDGENAADDGSIWSDIGEELSDEDMDYDSDEDSIHIQKQEGETNNTILASCLSEASKELLLWRLDKEESFSDWTIEVSIEEEKNEIRKATYHVHRNVLGLGPKKSGYFETLLKSGQFSESSNSVSVVELPAYVAQEFDVFLDYMYAQPFECKCIINRGNRCALQYMAKYFLVHKLTEDIHDFIKQDMNSCFVSMSRDYWGESEDRSTMKEYLTEFGEQNDESGKMILAFAARLCATNILHIDSMMWPDHYMDESYYSNESSLIPFMSPAMFLHIMREVRQSKDILILDDGDDLDDRGRNHICHLVLNCLRYHRDSIDASYFIALTNELYFPHDIEKASFVALRLLHLMDVAGWEEDVYEGIKSACTAILSRSLSDAESADAVDFQLLEITRRVSRNALSVVLRIQTLNAWKKQDVESFEISCKLMDDAYGPMGTILNATINSTDTINYIRYLLSRQLSTGFNIMDSEVHCEGKRLGVPCRWNSRHGKIDPFMLDEVVWNTSISRNSIFEIRHPPNR